MLFHHIPQTATTLFYSQSSDASLEVTVPVTDFLRCFLCTSGITNPCVGFTHSVCNREINTARSEGEEDCAVIDFNHSVEGGLEALEEGSKDFEGS